MSAVVTDLQRPSHPSGQGACPVDVESESGVEWGAFADGTGEDVRLAVVGVIESRDADLARQGRIRRWVFEPPEDGLAADHHDPVLIQDRTGRPDGVGELRPPHADTPWRWPPSVPGRWNTGKRRLLAQIVPVVGRVDQRRSHDLGARIDQRLPLAAQRKRTSRAVRSDRGELIPADLQQGRIDEDALHCGPGHRHPPTIRQVIAGHAASIVSPRATGRHATIR